MRSSVSSAPNSRLTVIAVGQTPPPYGGQAVMIKQFVNGRFSQIHVVGVRMAFSDDMTSVGRFRMAKLIRLVTVIAKIIYSRFRYGGRVLYYPPAGPEMIPFLRDVVVLISTRWLFRWTVFHFHAGGLSSLLPRLSTPLRVLFRLAYDKPDIAIVLSDLSPADDTAVRARMRAVVPNGLPDEYGQRYSPEARFACNVDDQRTPRILFVGVLRASKGVLCLAEACQILIGRGVDFCLDLIGEFQSPELERRVREQLHGRLAGRVQLLGVLTGDRKWEAFHRADVFCFPSYFEAENQPLVLIEAMQSGLPIIATRWRAIGSLVIDGANGMLVETADSQALADCLETLLHDRGRAEMLGAKGRSMYVANHTPAKWYEKMEGAILKLDCQGEAAATDEGRR